VNVITRRREVRPTVTSAVGQHGLVESGFQWAGGESGAHSIAVDGSRSGGFMTDRDFGTVTLAGRTTIDKTVVQAGYVRKEFGANGFYGASPSREWINQTMVGMERRLWQGASWSGNAVATYRTHGDRFLWDERNPGVLENLHRTHAVLGGVKVRGRLGEKSSATAGGEVGGDWITSSNLGDHRFARTGVFAEVQHAVGRLTIYPGVRFDRYSSFGSAWSPSLSAGFWVTPAVRLRGNGGRAFRIPTFTELYYRDPAHQASGDLLPESAWGAETGADWLIGTSWMVSGTVFARREKNDIDWVRETTAMKWRTTNLRRVNTRGVELEARRFVGSSGTITLQYTAVHTDALPIPLLSKYVLDYARQSWAVTSSVGLPWEIGLGQRVGWTERSNGTDYLVADLRVSRRFPRFEIFGEATNMFDQRYQEIAGVDMPGRWVRFGLTLSDFR
jgi:iron complex outermembrane receptor protein